MKTYELKNVHFVPESLSNGTWYANVEQFAGVESDYFLIGTVEGPTKESLNKLVYDLLKKHFRAPEGSIFKTRWAELTP